VKRVVSNSGTADGTTYFVYDQSGNIVAELDASGATVREYIWLPEAEIAPTMNSHAQVDRPVAVISGVNTASPAVLMVHVDHLNRPVKMTNSAGAEVWSAVYMPWGVAYSLTGAETNDARFPGQWFQLEAGLHYNWHRHYDPTLGRYTQPDPLGFVDGPSVYAYAGNSPLRFIDLDGEQLLVPSPEPLPPTLQLPKPPIPFVPPGPFPPYPIPDPDIYLPPPNPNPPSPGADNDYYHKICDQPPPAGLNACDSARWRLGRQRNCLKLRKKWRDDYGPAPHDNQIPQVEKSIVNLEDIIRKHCQPGDLAMCRLR